MTTAQVVETSVTVNNSPIQDYVHPQGHTEPTYKMTLGSNLSQVYKKILWSFIKFFQLIFQEIYEDQCVEFECR